MDDQVERKGTTATATMCCSYDTDYKFMVTELAIETNNHTVAQKSRVVEWNVCCWRKQKNLFLRGEY